MIVKSLFFTTAALLSFFAISPSAQAGQLFPPNNIGSNANVSCPNTAQLSPNAGVLTWNGDHVDCVNPTLGVTVSSCPAGSILTGINQGQPVCQHNGPFSVVAGQSVSCESDFVSQYGSNPVTFYGKVDATGQPYLCIEIAGVNDTGWVSGTYLEDRSLSTVWFPVLTMTTSGILGWHYEYHGYYPLQSSSAINTSLQEMAVVYTGQFTY